MKTQLIVALRVHREQFIMEHFIGSDDIFALVKEGSFLMESDGEQLVIREHEGALFRKNVLYHRRVISPVTMYLFRYKADAPAFSSDRVVFRDRERLSTTLAMLEELDTGVFGEDFEHRAHLFADLVLQHAMESRCVPSIDRCIEDAVNKIQRSLHTEIDLRGIAEQSGLSYVQFLRRFKRVCGMTPSDYVIALRLQKAKTLLSDTDLHVKEIAAACGFACEYYFSNFFKKHTSLSPTAFRQAARS